jgi:hypothetical protein
MNGVCVYCTGETVIWMNEFTGSDEAGVPGILAEGAAEGGHAEDGGRR